ncbi:hypothetical protein BDM02DRAFT_2529030 [Thelephora ganbajun]|uniref:Uncharacterized protein n=1 Tax=Thelephora ganbajun TaxID=370292 RepID=A0ACB6ZE58_THEGA|nr:hypothetical protein BDM02DRAFT_2529030 [Thelephora ganbajun]
MSSLTNRTTLVSSSASRQPRVVNPSNERRTRRHTRDFSHTSTTYAGDVSLSGRSTPREPDIDKDLPRIPSTSTELWGTEPVTVLSETMASAVTSPTLGPPPLSASQNLKRIAATEAQQIAAQYLRRCGSLEALRSGVSCPSRLEHHAEANGSAFQPGSCMTTFDVAGERMNQATDDSSCEERLSMDNGSEVSPFLPVTPTIRRLFTREVDMMSVSYKTRRMLKNSNQDGSFPCRQRGCYDALPTRQAYACHVHIHLIHEGLRLCELCGTRFIDDDHKDEHLGSCPKLPTFHEIESFSSEPPAGPLRNFLNRLHL